MILKIIKQFNWVDIFVVILLFRTTYSAIKRGIFIEFFKLLGTLLSCYLSLHYFTRIGDFFEARIPTPPTVPLEIWDFLAFLILMILGYLIFVILRETFFRFVKTEAVSILNRWGAVILGVTRGFILTSLIIFILSIPVINYFENSVADSFSGKWLIKVSTGVYSYFCKNLISKFIPKEEFNKVVLEVQEEILK